MGLLLRDVVVDLGLRGGLRRRRVVLRSSLLLGLGKEEGGRGSSKGSEDEEGSQSRR